MESIKIGRNFKKVFKESRETLKVASVLEKASK